LNNQNNYYKKFAEEKIKWRKRHKYYYDSLDALLKSIIPGKSKILEVGCASGDTIASLEPAYATGIDINPYLIEEAVKNHPQYLFLEEDIENENALNNINEKFDYIIISDLIGTLNDIQKVFEKLKKVSHTGTKVIVTYYNYFWNPLLKIAEKFNMKFRSGERNWLYLDEIQNLLYLEDFKTVKRGSLILIPKKIPLISNFFNKYIAGLPVIRRLCLVGYIIGSFSGNENETKKNRFSTTVMVPACNEAGHIDKIIEKIPQLGSHTEIIFVEGNSSDNTYEKVKEAIIKNPGKDIKLFKQPGKGKADAVRQGFDNATGDILMILDADMTVAPEDLTKFYNALQEEKGRFINGTRLVYQMEDKAMRPLNKFGNIFFSKIFSWLLGQRITDTLCGTKVLFRKDYGKIAGGRSYFGDFDPFGDFDLLFGAARLNLKIIEIPVRYGERIYGETNINRFRDGMLLLKMCFIAMKKIKFKLG
jgi:23S rRNA U2552 (ribose-2'-O)-methylase RlmE/FtsJ